MNEEAQIRSVALFYFLSLLDETKAKEATRRTINSFRKHLRIKDKSITISHSGFVKLIESNWKKASSISNAWTKVSQFESAWEVPNNINLSLWKAFQKEASPEELKITIWSLVLKLSDADIAEGLGVSEGTVRYRISKGLQCFANLQAGVVNE